MHHIASSQKQGSLIRSFHQASHFKSHLATPLIPIFTLSHASGAFVLLCSFKLGGPFPCYLPCQGHV